MKSFACFQVVLFTTLELYNENDVINHHGFERSVADTSKAELTTGRKNNVPHKIAKTFGKSFIVIRNEPSLSMMFAEKYIIPTGSIIFAATYWSVAISCYLGYF